MTERPEDPHVCRDWRCEATGHQRPELFQAMYFDARTGRQLTGRVETELGG